MARYTIEDTHELREKIKRLNQWQKIATLLNVGIIQPTEFCSVGCSDCGLGTTPIGDDGKNYAIPWDYLKELCEFWGPIWHSNKINGYWRSEPFDYSSQGDLNIEDPISKSLEVYDRILAVIKEAVERVANTI